MNIPKYTPTSVEISATKYLLDVILTKKPMLRTTKNMVANVFRHMTVDLFLPKSILDCPEQEMPLLDVR